MYGRDTEITKEISGIPKNSARNNFRKYTERKSSWNPKQSSFGKTSDRSSAEETPGGILEDNSGEIPERNPWSISEGSSVWLPGEIFVEIAQGSLGITREGIAGFILEEILGYNQDITRIIGEI